MRRTHLIKLNITKIYAIILSKNLSIPILLIGILYFHFVDFISDIYWHNNYETR